MRSPSPLRATFAAAIVGAYLVIGVLTVVGFLLSVRGIDLVFAVRYAQSQALLEKSRILSRIDREVALAMKLADDPIVRLWAVSEDDPRLRPLAMEELESYRRSFTDHSYFIAPLRSRHYYIHDSRSPNDQVQVTTLSAALPADAWYFDTLRTVESFALNVDYDRLIQAAKVWINVILRDASGAKIGICGTGIDITEFVRSFRRPGDAATTTILFDRAGVIQAHPNASYVLRNAETKVADKLTVYGLLSVPRQGEEVSRSIADLAEGRVEVATMPLTVEGRSYQAAVSSMPEIGWFNLVLVDASHAPRLRDYLPLAGTMLASLLLLLLVVALILSRAVLRPLSALAAAAGSIADGHYGIQIAVPRSAEMGQLAGAFNAMSATVRNTTEGLEMRVRERTRELTLANRELQESQDLVMESLSYARRVQAGILPAAAALARTIPEHMVIYEPRDVVGGDFYLVRQFSRHFVVAVIDCMGHGVPGAFISMTVHAVLSHVLDAVCNDDAARIIAELDAGIRDTLHRETAERRLDSGLDIALCVCSPAEGAAVFAGAGLALFVADDGGVVEVSGEKRRVGYRNPGTRAAWVNHPVPLGPSTTLSLVTDGFLDQSGGPRGFGFGRQRFAEMIGGVSGRSLAEQEASCRLALAEWQGGRPQRDDITMVGFRMPRRTGG